MLDTRQGDCISIRANLSSLSLSLSLHSVVCPETLDCDSLIASGVFAQKDMTAFHFRAGEGRRAPASSGLAASFSDSHSVTWPSLGRMLCQPFEFAVANDAVLYTRSIESGSLSGSNAQSCAAGPLAQAIEGF